MRHVPNYGVFLPDSMSPRQPRRGGDSPRTAGWRGSLCHHSEREFPLPARPQVRALGLRQLVTVQNPAGWQSSRQHDEPGFLSGGAEPGPESVPRERGSPRSHQPPHPGVFFSRPPLSVFTNLVSTCCSLSMAAVNLSNDRLNTREMASHS